MFDLSFLEIKTFITFRVDFILHIDTFIKNELLLNGKSPKSILNIITPTAHMSTLWQYTLFLKIYGAMYEVVPQKVFTLSSSSRQNPRSHIFVRYPYG